MKIFSLIIFAILLTNFSLLATDYAKVDEVTMSSSFNDFAAVKAAVKMTIGDAQIKGEGSYIVYYWDGDSWEDPYEDDFWEPNLPIWGTLQFDDDVDIAGIVDNGNSSFRVKFTATADQAMDVSGYYNFSVTDVVAPSTPTNFSGSWDNGNEETGHPRLDWDANSETDLKEYEVWKKVDAYTGGNIDPWAKKTSTTNTYYIDNSEIGWEYLAHPRVVYYKIRAVDQTSNYSGYTSAEDFYCNNGPHVDSFEGYLAEIKVPNDHQLLGNFPNPFNPSTTIHYFIPEAQDIKIAVFDVNGKKVQTLFSGNQESGFHFATFNGTSLPSGIYYYRMTAGQFSEAKRMLLVK